MASLTDKILATKHLDLVGTAHDNHFCRLKTLMRSFVENYLVVHQVVRLILQYMVQQQCTTCRDLSWDAHWKLISHHAYDVSQTNQVIDYGNIEYCMLLSLFEDLNFDDGLFLVQILAMAQFFPSLHPDAVLSDKAVEKQADVIEIVIAALRGHEYFRPIFPNIAAISGRRLPQLLVVFRPLQDYSIP